MLEVKKEIQERKVSDIIFKEDIYARFNEDNTLIGRYVENTEAIKRYTI